MSFAAVARLLGVSWYRVHSICTHYVEMVMSKADRSSIFTIAIDETSLRRGHNYVPLVVDMTTRRLKQKADPDLKGLRWALLKTATSVTPTSATILMRW